MTDLNQRLTRLSSTGHGFGALGNRRQQALGITVTGAIKHRLRLRGLPHSALAHHNHIVGNTSNHT